MKRHADRLGDFAKLGAGSRLGNVHGTRGRTHASRLRKSEEELKLTKAYGLHGVFPEEQLNTSIKIDIYLI
jgi:hypothetical protein